MNPWLWILWSVVVLVVLFVASAAFAAIVDVVRKPNPCPRCGFDGALEDYPPSTPPHVKNGGLGMPRDLN